MYSRADKIQGDTVHTDPDSLNMTLKEPYGVCGLIVPVSHDIGINLEP
jgi:acyl-CoA reductase-like NAD-dependent aldehyde dehydrogenase